MVRPNFTLTLIDRAITGDNRFTRFKNFRTIGLIQDGKDLICSNMNLQSMIQYSLVQDKDLKMVDLYIQEIYQNNKYSVNKYSQMMRILPLMQQNKDYDSPEYFQFFSNADQQLNAADDDDDDDELDDDFFKGEELPDSITYN